MGANDSTGIASAIGQPVLRKEDARFLTGTGQFTDDVTMVRQTHAYFLRSPHAHATIRAELEGNICRCTGYHNIVKAVRQGAAEMGR